MRIATVSRTKPITLKGISFDSRNRDLGTGETFICSIVPFSFSLTIFKAEIDPPNNRQQEYHDAGNHIDLVAQVGIEQVNRGHSPSRSHRGETFLPIEILYNRGEIGATQAALGSAHGVSSDDIPFGRNDMGEPLQDIRHILYRKHHATQQHDRKHQSDIADQHSRLLGIGYRRDQQGYYLNDQIPAPIHIFLKPPHIVIPKSRC